MPRGARPTSCVNRCLCLSAVQSLRGSLKRPGEHPPLLYPLVIFRGCRLMWQTPSPPGSDRLGIKLEHGSASICDGFVLGCSSTFHVMRGIDETIVFLSVVLVWMRAVVSRENALRLQGDTHTHTHTHTHCRYQHLIVLRCFSENHHRNLTTQKYIRTHIHITMLTRPTKCNRGHRAHDTKGTNA